MDNLEEKQVAVTKLELSLDEFLQRKKKEMLFNPINARFEIEKMRKDYLLNDNTITFFAAVGLIKDYTNLLNKYNKVLDGDLS